MVPMITLFYWISYALLRNNFSRCCLNVLDIKQQIELPVPRLLWRWSQRHDEQRVYWAASWAKPHAIHHLTATSCCCFFMLCTLAAATVDTESRCLQNPIFSLLSQDSGPGVLNFDRGGGRGVVTAEIFVPLHAIWNCIPNNLYLCNASWLIMVTNTDNGAHILSYY